MKQWQNQVQATEAKYEENAVVEEEVVTKDLEDYVGNSTSQHKEGYGRFNGIPIYGHL